MTAAPKETHGADEDPRIQAAIEQLNGVLVPGETLQAYTVQRRLFALSKRRLLVGASTGRLLVLRRNLLGGFHLSDLRWQDLKDVKLNMGIFGADLTVTTLDQADLATQDRTAGVFLLPGLRKEGAQGVYRICQAQEQQWREKRRVRDLEELRAKSGGLQLGGVGGVTGVAGGAASGADAVERLKAAKEMLANGLITDSEFEAIKAKVVSGL